MKKIVNCFVIFLTFLVLNSCSSSVDYPPLSDVKEKTIIGYYIYGHEVNSFQPCNKKEIFWVKSSNKLLVFMARKYSDYATQPYDEVFVELIGGFESRATDGFSMDYDGQIHVTKMVLMKKKINADCNVGGHAKKQ